MAIELASVLWAGFLASIAAFVLGSIYYFIPPIMKAYARLTKGSNMRKWKDTRAFLAVMYLTVLFHCMLYAFAYWLLKPVFVWGFLTNTAAFGAVIVALAILPDLSNKAVLTNQPKKLLLIDTVYSVLVSFLIALTLVYLM
jgi:hypothetical protein